MTCPARLSGRFGGREATVLKDWRLPLLLLRLTCFGMVGSGPVALLVNIMDLGRDWRGQWLFYSEDAEIVGVSILLEKTAHIGSRQ